MGTPNHYLFVANDVPCAPGRKISAETIADTLLKARFWAFTEHAQGRARLTPGDRVIIYLAGRGRQHFVAAAEVQSTSRDPQEREKEILSQLGLSFMRFTVPLSGVRKFDSPIPIGELIERLRFIKDRKHYGLHLRSPVVRITEDDYNLIMSQASVHDRTS